MKLDSSDFATLDDQQRLAVLESLVIGIIADGQVTPAEIRRFDEIVLALPWGVERDVLVAMIKGAHERLQAIKTPMAINDYLAKLATRLPSPELRDKVVFTMATLMWSDGEVSKVEQNVLGAFTLAFNITNDRIAKIRAALTGQPAPTPAQPDKPTN